MNAKILVADDRNSLRLVHTRGMVPYGDEVTIDLTSDPREVVLALRGLVDLVIRNALRNEVRQGWSVLD